MPNPFPNKFPSECINCDNFIETGELMYAHEKMFICGNCAVEGNLICECGNYKKEQYKVCFTCGQNKKAPSNQTTSDEDDSWMSGDLIEQVRKKKKKDELPF